MVSFNYRNWFRTTLYGQDVALSNFIAEILKEPHQASRSACRPQRHRTQSERRQNEIKTGYRPDFAVSDQRDNLNMQSRLDTSHGALYLVTSFTAASVRAQIRFECSMSAMDVEYHQMQFSPGSRRNNVACNYVLAVSSR